MNAQTKTAAAVFGGMVGVVMAVGIGGVSATPTVAAPAAHSTGVASTQSETGAGVHLATLAGCVSGLDC